MKVTAREIAVSLFGATTLLTVWVYGNAWHIDGYFRLLSALAVLSGILAIVVVGTTGLRWKTVLAVALGLLIGQWWLIQFVVTQLMWGLAGFSP